jgi:hypothetical protein
MEKNIHKECEKTYQERSKGNRPDEGIESQAGTVHSGTRDPEYLGESCIEHNVDGTSETEELRPWGILHRSCHRCDGGVEFKA